jgi:hypothetical protein
MNDKDAELEACLLDRLPADIEVAALDVPQPDGLESSSELKTIADGGK